VEHVFDIIEQQVKGHGVLRLVTAEPRILRIFEISGLVDVFTIFPSVEQALVA
jgi:hypothetical protein